MRALVLRAAGCVAALLVAGPLCAQIAEPGPGDVLPPVQADLEPVPLPLPEGLEEAVVAQISAARATFSQTAADARASKNSLASAYGELGRLFHAYEFFGSAEPAYRNAARLQRSEAAWPHLLGYLYQQTGRFEDAARQFAAALRVKADDRAAALRLGDVWLELNRLSDAREQYGSLLTVFPAAARRGLGEVSLRERRYREAVEHFTLALERAPQASALHYSLAMAYRGLGRLDDARAHLERRGPGVILAVDPYADALPGLIRGERLLVIQGSRAHAAGRFREAAAAFERALEVAPTSVPARVNLASALVQLGDVPGAVEQLRAARATAPGDLDVGRELVALLLKLGRRDEAMDVLTAIHQTNPDDEDTAVALAILLAEREKFGEAIAVLDGAHRQFPARPATATTLARLLASSPDVARRDGARALALATEVYDAEPRASHAETVALALAELGRCGEALEWMRRALTAAEAENDAAQLERLRSEVPRYQSASCRAPGR
jgi:tetratricopeptide (TPR) repeat protein